MKFQVTVSALVCSAALLAACSNDAASPSAADVAEADAVPASVDVAPASVATPAAVADKPLANNAPAFASLYPEAELTQPVVLANDNGNAGGIAEFTTVASPEMIVDHYRQLADQDGLEPVMAMNQGNARAFAAKSKEGAELQVVASPSEDGQTSVQLTWQAAK